MEVKKKILFTFVFLIAGSLSADEIIYNRSENDSTSLSGNIHFKHFAQSIEGSENKTVLDLLEGNYSFSSTPTPTRLLKHQYLLNPPAVGKSQGELQVLSYNVALLIAKVMWIWDYQISPNIDERIELLPKAIFERNYDVVLLQEVWRDEDVAHFKQAAGEFGYIAYAIDRGPYNDGLMTFIRKDVVESEKVSVKANSYKNQNLIEFFPGPGVKHGYHRLSFKHKNVGNVQIYNTHLIPMPTEWERRMLQARELGQIVAENAKEDSIAIVGGDMNAAPYYTDDNWVTKDHLIEPHWWQNALAYPMLLFYGNMKDMMIMGRGENSATDDIDHPQFVSSFIEQNGFSDEWCSLLPDSVFTGVDCNSLFKVQYEGSEFPARLDHLLLHDPSNTVRVINSEITFKERIDITEDFTSELSDHYGIVATIEKFK